MLINTLVKIGLIAMPLNDYIRVFCFFRDFKLRMKTGTRLVKRKSGFVRVAGKTQNKNL